MVLSLRTDAPRYDYRQTSAGNHGKDRIDLKTTHLAITYIARMQ
jgi:hypothetical protein